MYSTDLTFIENEAQVQVFSSKTCQIFQKKFLIEHLRSWLTSLLLTLNKL